MQTLQIDKNEIDSELKNLFSNLPRGSGYNHALCKWKSRFKDGKPLSLGKKIEILCIYGVFELKKKSA